MTDYEYDPDLPYVVEGKLSELLYARFASQGGAREYANSLDVGLRVIDTTPNPRVPDDAQWLTWRAASGVQHFALRDSDGSWYCRDNSQAEVLEDLPGVTPDTVFTVLDEREI